MARGLYWTCEYGANHDHGERCDCFEEKTREQERLAKMYELDKKSRQYAFNFDGKEAVM